MENKAKQYAHAANPFALPRQLNDGSVADWLMSLPLANRDFSMRAVLAISKEVSRKGPVSCQERQAMLERLRPVMEMLVQQCIEVQLADEAFPLSQRAQRVANYCFLLALEMGHGYRRIAVDARSMEGDAWTGQQRATAMYRALQAYGQALLRVTECYQPAPQSFWHSIYELYRLAETHRLFDEHWRGPVPGEDSGSIRDRFLAIMLFSLAQTNRHRPWEIRLLYDLINRFASHAQIHRAAVTDHQRAFFAIDLAADRGPCRIEALKGDVGEGIRFLFTAGFVEQLLAHFSGAAGQQEASRKWSSGLIGRLARSMGAPERRKSQRLPDAGKCVVIVGLKQTIDALQRGRSAETLPAGSSAFLYKGVKWLDVPDLKVEDLPDRRASRRDRTEHSEIAVGTLLAERPGSLSREDIWGDRRMVGPALETDLPTHSASAVNSSARGYCLLWTERSAACLRVGELIGFPSERGTLHIGVVRWLGQAVDGDLMLGIELLAPRIQVVRLAVSGRGAGLQVALFVPPEQRLSEAAILVQPASFDVGQVLAVENAGRGQRYRIAKLLESSPSFQMFALAEEHGPPVVMA